MGKLILNSLLLGTCILLSFMANGQSTGNVAANNGEQQPIVYTSPELQVISTRDITNVKTVTYTSPELQILSVEGSKSSNKNKSKKKPVVYTSPELQIKKD